ncbi:MAG TPA: translocation/assembly module TamB domain-containing protein [Noviherbaspirillum sp.]|nr:translocation/assembly module TamB domain-containing protein [Noviherbaspirillum sp.]
MASDTGRKRWRVPRLLIAALAVPVILLAACAWLLGTTSGARVLLSAAGDAVDAQGVDGRVAGPLQIGRLRVKQKDSVIELSDIRLEWRPLDLLRGTLHVERLHVRHVLVRGGPDEKQEKLRLPESISLPMALQLDELRLDGGEIRKGPDTVAALGPLALRLTFDGSRYQLVLDRLSAGSVRESGQFNVDFNGSATLSTTRPYAIDGRFASKSKASIEEHPLGASGTLTLGGSLEQLEAAIDLAVNRADVNGSVVVRPFSEAPLGRSQLQARSIDLSQFAPGMPVTVLDIRLDTDKDGAGELSVTNAAAGTWDAGRLPLQSLTAGFRQDPKGIAADRITIHLGTPAQPAGNILGRGRFGDDLTLSLRTEGLDLKRLDRRARATRLTGEAELSQSAQPVGMQEIRLALSEPLENRQSLALDAHAVRSGQEISLRRVELRAGSGRMNLAGRIALDGRQAFDAQGTVNAFRLRELGAFPQLPDLDLSGKFSLHGTRQPQLDADLSFNIADSRLAGQPLRGDGEARVRGEHLEVPRLQLASGANRLNIEGRLTGDDARLTFALDAPQLGQLGSAFGGALQASGIARGTLQKPRVDAEWNANGALLPGGIRFERMQGKAQIAVDRSRAFIIESGNAALNASGLRHGDEQLSELAAQLRLSPQPDAPLSLDVRAKGISTARLRADQLTVTAIGTTAAHTIDVALNEPGQAWTMKAAGGLSQLETSPRWKGNIQSLDAKGRLVARLTSPAPLLLSAERVQLDNFLVDADSGRFVVEQFLRDETGIATRGRVERLQLANLLQHAVKPPPVKTDLELSGEWNVRIADALTGTLAMRRERGDLTVLANAPVSLGLSNLTASATASSGRLALQVQAIGKQLGRIELNGGTAIGTSESLVAVPPGAPLVGNMRIDVPSLAWIGPLLSPTTVLDGRLQSDVSLDGTVAQPNLAGRINGQDLRVALADLGLDLRQGTLDSEFRGEQLVIRALSFQGEEGKVSLSGPIDFSGGTVAAQLSLVAERFLLLNRSDRRIVVSGTSELSWRDKHGKAGGSFTIDSGFIDLGSADKPRLSDDVVIVGSEKKQATNTTAFDLDMTIALGDGVVLKGRGIDAVLAGQVRLLSNAGEPLRAQGALNIVKGSYSAYGRELAIEQGLLRFRGALNNPSLDILAMRREQEVEAGVSIRGTALAPRIALVSEPPVPDAEKLSWLVLGRGLATTGDADTGALQSAAAALLAQGAAAGVQSRAASGFGLDTFSVGTSQDSLHERIVTVGKRISSRLYLGYQQGLESAASVVQVRYTLTPKLSLEAEAGTRSALLLFYNIAFD